MKLAALSLALAFAANAQTVPTEDPIRTYHLNYAVSQQEQSEILSAVRNIGSASLRVFLVPSRNEVLVSGTPQQLATVEQILAKLDVPALSYRLTYIFTETEGGKRIGVQQYSMTLTPGQRMQMKEGDRVPIFTGSTGANPTDKQMTYLDVGFNFESTIDSYGPEGARLTSRIERSSIAEQKSAVGGDDPLIRQSFLSGVTNVTLGKPQHLGNIDIIGSTRQLQVDALIELIK